AGRWAPLRPAASGADALQAAELRTEAVEHVVRTLLRRYGVLCWRLLEREAAWLPPWRELLRVCQRLEARGELRGGRFIEGLSGEQFALPEAIGLLRQARRDGPAQQWLSVSACDPANLLGSVLPGERVPRVPGNRVLYLDGLPVAAWVADKFVALPALTPGHEAQAREQLSARPAGRAAVNA
ncbi:MAG TPA: ATP-dependent DNA helicase, partial [Stenotrophomonas sp.]